MDLFSVKGKVALVTGGSRGIGLLISEGYVRSGAKTYISSRDAAVCEAEAKRLSEFGECIALPSDLSSMDGVKGLAAAIAEREDKLDVLVNNAGANWAAPIDDFPESGWDKVMTLNIKSPFFLAQQCLPLLRKGGDGDDPARIINVASIDGLHTSNLETYSYAASKAGLIHLTRVLARRLAQDNIVVNAIAPGPFQSKMMAKTLEDFGDAIAASNPRGRIGTFEDMAGTAIFLASRASAYINGTVIPVDGGTVSVS